MFSRILQPRLVFPLITTILLIYVFWTGSRYPALDDKAQSAGNIHISGLAFEPLLDIPSTASYLTQVLYNTINWINTNLYGMGFGLMLAACLMTLLAQWPGKQFKNSYLNAAFGLIAGAPLGVCVNCASPIALGIRAAGGKPETALAMMISSPTFNIILLIMIFTFLPLYMVGLKLISTLLFILIGIPLLIKYFDPGLNEQPQTNSSIGVGPYPVLKNEQIDTSMSWTASFMLFLRNWLHNLWFILVRAVPLMLLAGLLGAIAITYLPFDVVADLNKISGGQLGHLFALCFIAVIGLFLPVPIAFDVIICIILWSAGVRASIVMTLFFTLGAFSVYAYFIVQQSISRRIATAVFISLAAMGVINGVAAGFIDRWYQARQLEIIQSTFSNPAPVLPSYSKPEGSGFKEIASMLTKQDASQVNVQLPSYLALEELQLGKTDQVSESIFEQIDGATLGLDEPNINSPYKLIPPYMHFGGLSAGDVHNDGFPDLVVTSDVPLGGISLFANINGISFQRQLINLNELERVLVTTTALVDLNNDGWLDIFLATWDQGNWIIYNSRGSFEESVPIRLPGQESSSARAVAFGDIDEDGDLDIALGHWTAEAYFLLKNKHKVITHPDSGVVLLLNNNGNFKEVRFNDLSGASLTALLSDINNDQHLDLVIGNDFWMPDRVYYGQGNGIFKKISDSRIPYSTMTTMSVTSVDVNNDLNQEIYFAAIADGKSVKERGNKNIKLWDICTEELSGEERYLCFELETTATHFKNSHLRSPSQCPATLSQQWLELCVAYSRSMWDKGIYENIDFSDRPLLDDIKKRLLVTKVIPDEFHATKYEHPYLFIKDNIPQRMANDQNVLLTSYGNEDDYNDIAQEAGIDVTGWTWNAKFADLNQDGWQDLFVVNGTMHDVNRQRRNSLYMNSGNGKFIKSTDQPELSSGLPTISYVYADFDLDGDLDIITRPSIIKSPQFYRNTSSGNTNSILFALDDQHGNRYGIGSKIIIHYGNKQQMREVLASGGYISFDPPIVHFGLGDYEQVNAVEVHWSTGEVDIINNSFNSNTLYRIKRK